MITVFIATPFNGKSADQISKELADVTGKIMSLSVPITVQNGLDTIHHPDRSHMVLSKVRNAAIILFYVPANVSDDISIGSIIELTTAHNYGIPIIAVIEDSITTKVYKTHSLLTAQYTVQTDSLDEGIEYVHKFAKTITNIHYDIGDEIFVVTEDEEMVKALLLDNRFSKYVVLTENGVIETYDIGHVLARSGAIAKLNREYKQKLKELDTLKHKLNDLICNSTINYDKYKKIFIRLEEIFKNATKEQK